MSHNQEAEKQRLAELRERCKQGFLEEMTIGFGLCHCKNCETYFEIHCFDTPGDRLFPGDEIPVECPKCSNYLGEYLSGVPPVFILISKESAIEMTQIWESLTEPD